MKNRHILLFSVSVLVLEYIYFFISGGPFIELGVPCSEQLSGGNDDRLALAFGSLFFVIPVIYGLITLPFRFKGKDAISIATYLFSFGVWALYVMAVNFDTSLSRSFEFGDWYLAPYLIAPFIPLVFMVYHIWLTRRSTGR